MTRVPGWLLVCASVGGMIAACEPPVPRPNTLPKNGVATSRQTQGDKSEDEDDGKPSSKTPKSCTSTCRQKHSAVLSIHDAHVSCVKDCDDDATCIGACDDDRAVDCDGSDACDDLDTCLGAC